MTTLRRPMVLLILYVLGAWWLPVAAYPQDPPVTRIEDVIYARKYGTALTLDVLTPRERVNGAAIVWVVSGGWFSAHEAIHTAFVAEYLRRGYTVFAVVHGSQPQYTIPEIIEDMHRSVRFIRYNASAYHIDPQRIGITGRSAGGHLSLMIAMSGKPGPAESKDPVDRETSRVQAVGCFFPPTDFLNYGQEGRDVFTVLEEELAAFKAPFDFRELDPKSHRFHPIEDRGRRMAIAGEISPITHVTPDDPPTLIIHGDADKLVPLQQSQTMEKRLRAVHVPVKVIVKPGAGHGWADFRPDMEAIGNWFDRYLAEKPATSAAAQN